MRDRFWAAVPAAVLLLAGAAWPQLREEGGADRVRAEVRTETGKGGVDLSRVEKLIADRTNAFRRDQGRDPVQRDPQLAETAQYFADFMARTDKYGHTADGQRPSQRAQQHGYDYCIVLENIAYQYSSAGFATEELARKFFAGWQDSPGHRENMLDPDVSETGVAVTQSKDSGHYYAVQMFGRPGSERIEFTVVNHAGTEVHYTVGGKSFPLPPRFRREHVRCRPPELTIDLSPGGGGESGTRTFHPVSGDRFTVTAGGAGGLEVRAE